MRKPPPRAPSSDQLWRALKVKSKSDSKANTDSGSSSASASAHLGAEERATASDSGSDEKKIDRRERRSRRDRALARRQLKIARDARFQDIFATEEATATHVEDLK